MSDAVTVAARFCGPPASGNGGYAAGVAAKALGRACVEATLLAPPPLDAPLDVIRDGAEIALVHDGREIVRARPGELSPPEADAPSLAAARAASDARPWSNESHPFPGCFVCGPARGEGDGLRIFCGPLASGGVAAVWTPDSDLAEDDGLVASEFVWAALDCPSYFALPRAGTFVALLGRMTARIVERPAPGAPLIVAARAEGSDGRKHASTSALYDAEGRLLAHAACLWIALKEQAA